MRKFFWITLLWPVWACGGEVGAPSGELPYADGAAMGADGMLIADGSPGSTSSSTTSAQNGAGGGMGADTTVASGTSTSVTTTPTNSGGAGAGDLAATAGAGAIVDGAFPPAPMVLSGDPIYTRFMRLTNEQWDRAVQDILQLDQSPDMARTFQTPVVGSTDFVNNEAVLEVTNDLWQQYQLAVEAVVEQLTADDAGIARIYSGSDSREFITLIGRRAFRRPLTESELTRLQVIFDSGSTTSGSASAFVKGAGLVIETLLQSPYFIYRTELGTSGQPLNGYEIASKLSFLLLGTTPSDALLDSAATDLTTPDGIRAAAEQMLNDARASEMALEFHSEVFEFSRFADIAKDVAEFNPAIRGELEESSRLFFRRVFDEGLGLHEVLTSTRGYVGPEMADLYGLPRPAGSELVLQDLGPERVGYFSQVPFLLLYGDNEHSDAIHRGVVMNFEVLCANIPPPPPVVPSLASATATQTDRERVAVGTAGCGGGCHDAYINPLGFAFENFDGLGRLRSTDKGYPVDTGSEYPFVEGTYAFEGAPGLMGIMDSTQMAHRCYAKNLAGFTLQRDIAETDQALIDQLATSSMQPGSSLRQLVLELVTNPAFVNRPGGTP